LQIFKNHLGRISGEEHGGLLERYGRRQCSRFLLLSV
jgi:hypothetical protein